MSRPAAAPALRARRSARLLLVSLALAWAPGAAATTALSIAEMAGDGWSARDLRLAIDWSAAHGPRLRLEAAAVVLPEPVGTLRELRLVCPAVALSARRLACRKARLTGRHRDAAFTADARFVYDAATRRAEIEVPPFALAGGTLGLEATLGGGTPTLTLTAADLDLARLPPIAALALDGGRADLELHLKAGAASGGSGRVVVRDAAFSDASGRRAGEALDAALDFTLARDGAAWSGHAGLALEAGGVYVEPVYLDLTRHPLALDTAFRYAPAGAAIELSDLRLSQPGVLVLTAAHARLAEGRLETLSADFPVIEFPAAYRAWLAGALIGTPLATLETGGRMRASVEFAEGRPLRLAVQLEALDLEDREGRFALYKLDGTINWARSGAAVPGTSLDIGGGYVYGATFDATELEFGIAGAAVDLLEPARVPLLGGALVIHSFTLRDYGGEDVVLGLEAELEPIELARLTLALDWPGFSGELSGRLPLLTYQHGVVTLGGDLEARAFDGDITITHLRVVEPFGVVPEIGANIRLRNLDLEQLTQIVPFGSVSGRLDGDIEGLRLLKGEAVAFDARLGTPPDDDSRHRLSQRAVDTIARVAGGSAVLSTTFLRVFKHFPYDKLGIACRLVNDVCHMDGIAPAEDGYYIVKGAWLPRVDLIGRVREVHWSRLLAQLQAALDEGEFVIE